MHIALIIDSERMLHEGPMLSRLCVGLLDSGNNVTRIVPAVTERGSEPRRDSASGVANQISVPMKVLPWLRRPRVEQVAQAMQRSDPDVVYGWGRETWPLALDLSKRFECPAAINIWSVDLLRVMPKGRLSTSVGAYIAPSRALATAAREVVDASLVSYVPQGVAIPTEPSSIFEDPQRPISIAVIGSGRDLLSYRALLNGMSKLLKQNFNVQIALELRGPQQHEIWKQAQRLELLGNISAITDAARFRSLLTHCDMLVLPERFGEVRSLILEAMACGLPIIAAEDPYLDFLIADETALLVPDAEADLWAAQLRKLLSSPDFSRQLGRAGRRYVQEHHASSSQVSALQATLERAVHGESFDFSSGS